MSIETILKTPEWDEIEEMLLDEFIDGKKPINFKTEGKSNEQIAGEARAREYSAKSVKRFLAKLKRIKDPVEIKKESYK